MPTTRPRHMITETDDVRDAIDTAARVWPELGGDRPALLRRLIERGARQAIDAEEDRERAWQETVDRTAGALDGVYPPGTAQRLREEWPE